jgi:hypothetical protein
MRFSRMQGVLTAAALLALVPLCGHAAPAAPAPAAPSLTPPGSSTSVPLLPGPAASGAGASPIPNFSFPSTSLNTPGGAAGTPNAIPAVPLPNAGFGSTAGGLPPPNFGYSNGMGTDLSSLLSGSSSMPLSMTLGQLDSHWYRMTIVGSLGLGNLTQSLTSLFSSAGVGVYYTKGKTVSVGETTYLVTYRAQPPMLNFGNLAMMLQGAAMTSTPPHASAMTSNTPLAICLVNLQTAGSLSDIRAFDLKQELADNAAAVHAYNSLMDSFGMAVQGHKH